MYPCWKREHEDLSMKIFEQFCKTMKSLSLEKFKLHVYGILSHPPLPHLLTYSPLEFVTFVSEVAATWLVG